MVYGVYAHLLFKSPATGYNTGSGKRKGAKFGEGSSIRAGLIGCASAKLVGSAKEGNSNRGHFFCPSL